MQFIEHSLLVTGPLYLLLISSATASSSQSSRTVLNEHKPGHTKVEVIPADASLREEKTVPEAVEEKLGSARVYGTRKDGNSRSVREEPLSRSELKKTLQRLEALKRDVEKEIKELKRKVRRRNGRKKHMLKSKELLRVARHLLAREVSRIKRADDSDIFIPYRACIYIDDPVSPRNTSVSVEPLSYEKVVKMQVQPAPEGNKENYQRTEEQVSMHSKTQNSQDSDIDDVYWMRVPSKNTNKDKQETINKMEATVDEIHHHGDDALIIPIKSGYANPNDLKKGFMKSLHVTPEEARYSKFDVKII